MRSFYPNLCSVGVYFDFFTACRINFFKELIGKGSKKNFKILLIKTI